MTLEGVDLSSHNPDIDWPAVTADFVFVKATEGIDYANPLQGAQLAGARARGLIVGHYHYARQDRGDTPEAEADFFLADADIRAGELLALDFEVPSAGDLNAWALAYLARIEARLPGIVPFIYTYPDFIRQYLSDPRLARYPLWLASYDDEAQPVAPWSRVAVWQYAGDATGVPGCGDPTDRNRFAGTREELLALGRAVTADAVPDDASSSARLLGYYRNRVPAELRGAEDNATFYEGHADFATLAGAPWPEGHFLHTEYLTLWTWPGQPIRGLQPATEADLAAVGKLVKYGG